MSVIWGLPLAFAGLAALMVPVLLHLDRRRSVQRVPFAALRWIAAQARPRRTWRLVERLLLALRLLLVAMAVAWLAQPWLRGFMRAPVHWIAVATGIDAPAGEHVVRLVRGFPPADRVMSPSQTDPASFSSLLREFDARLAPGDTLEVLVPAVVHGLDAAAIELSREVRWTVREASATPPPSGRAPRLLALRADSASPALRAVRAAFRAWQADPALAVRVDEGAPDVPVPNEADAVLCLPRVDASSCGGDAGVHAATASATPPASTPGGVRAVLAAQNASMPEGVGAVAKARPRVLVLDASAWGAAPDQSAEFPRWLHGRLFGEATPPQSAPADAVAPRASATAFVPPPTPLRGVFAWIVAGLFLLERGVATLRTRRAP